MKCKINVIFVLLVSAIVLIGCGDSLQSYQASVQPTSSVSSSSQPSSQKEQPKWPVLSQNASASSTEVTAVKELLKHSYRVQWEEDGNNYSYSNLADVYTNAPDVPLLERQRKFVQEVIGVQGDAAKSVLKDEGYLTLMTASQLNAKKAKDNWEHILAKAKSEGRSPNNLTPDEQRALDEGVIGGAGGYDDPKATRKPYVDPPLEYKEINVEGKYADVTYDDGAALYHAFLVKTVDGWKIAGTVLLKAHL